MTEVTAPYPPGTPCWVSLAVPDQSAALDFYCGLFGWTGSPGAPETGGYAVCAHNGRAVAGMLTARPDGAHPPPPTAWTTFLAADDADATARRVTAAGGALLVEPGDVPDGSGRMFVGADPAGAAFGVWQPGDFVGAGIVNEPGAMVWNELRTTDLAASATFYRRVLGVGVTPYERVPGYFTVDVAGRGVAGMREAEGPVPPGAPSAWLTYFAVEDTDRTAEAAVAAGASVVAAPHEMVAGRTAVLADPQGGVFAVLARPPVF